MKIALPTPVTMSDMSSDSGSISTPKGTARSGRSNHDTFTSNGRWSEPWRV